MASSSTRNGGRRIGATVRTMAAASRRASTSRMAAGRYSVTSDMRNASPSSRGNAISRAMPWATQVRAPVASAPAAHLCLLVRASSRKGWPSVSRRTRRRSRVCLPPMATRRAPFRTRRSSVSTPTVRFLPRATELPAVLPISAARSIRSSSTIATTRTTLRRSIICSCRWSAYRRSRAPGSSSAKPRSCMRKVCTPITPPTRSSHRPRRSSAC